MPPIAFFVHITVCPTNMMRIDEDVPFARFEKSHYKFVVAFLICKSNKNRTMAHVKSIT